MKRRPRGARQRLRRERLSRGRLASSVNLGEMISGGYSEGEGAHPMAEGLVFRPRRAVRLPVVMALILWCLVGGGLLGAELLGILAVPLDTYVTVALFILCFLGVVFHYHHFAIVVDLSGVAIVGAASFRSFLWGEIIQVEGGSPFFPGVQVYARSGESFGFSGLVFSEHRSLLEIIELYSGNR